MTKSAITVPLEEVCDFQNGFAFKNSDYVDEAEGTLEIFRMGNIERGGGFRDDGKRVFVPPAVADRLARFRLMRGDILMSMTDMKASMALLGHTAVCPVSGRFLLNQRVGRITARRVDLLDQTYLYYYTNSPNYIAYLRAHANSGVQVNLSTEAIRGSPVRLPCIEVQQRIASILSSYDDLIENNTRRIAILEEMARRIYEEWFVCFRFPGHEGVRMVESELGLVPEGWAIRRLGDEIELAYGKALKADDRRLGEVPVYGSSGVVGSHDTSLVAGQGIIVGRKGNVGSVHWSEVPFFPIDTVYYVVTDLPLHYVYFNLQRQNFLNNDAAVPGLNRNQAYSLPLVVPARGALDGFEDHCQQLLGLARLLARKNDNLRTTRDLLLPKLISGELDVSAMPEPEALAA